VLRGRDGASALEDAWIAGRLGDSRFLVGTDAEAAACDALIVPVVTGHPDMTVIDQVIELVLTATGHGAGDRAGDRGSPGVSDGTTAGDSDGTIPGDSGGTTAAGGRPAAAAALPPEGL